MRARLILPCPTEDVRSPENLAFILSQGWRPEQHVETIYPDEDSYCEQIVDVFSDVWTVAVYMASLSHGGSEEGGWWFESGSLEDLPVLYFDNKTEAYAAREFLQGLLDKGEDWNLHLREMSSVLCTGRYTTRVSPGHPKPGYPDRRPRYE